jgi:hypothetical protein
MNLKLLVPVSMLSVMPLMPAQAVVLAKWTFETSVPTTAGPHAAEVGTGSALGFHSNGATVWSNPVGNGSAESFSANTWTSGDYFQFQTSTVGFEDITLYWEQTRSSTGPASFSLQWSTDGTTFVNAVASYSVGSITWSSVSYTGGSSNFVSLSSIGALDNDASVYFRLVSLVTPATAGTSRVDDFTISATALVTPVPEVTTVGLGAFVGGLAFFGIRNRLKSR